MLFENNIKILKKYFGSTSRNSDQESTETTMMILIPWVSYLVGEVTNQFQK